jgi:hypothetical protein
MARKVLDFPHLILDGLNLVDAPKNPDFARRLTTMRDEAT